MKSNIATILGSLTCAVGIFAASRAAAAVQVRQETRAIVTSETRSVSSLIGAPVQLRVGGRIGTVRDFVIGERLDIAYLVVEFERSLILVPFDLVVVDFSRPVIIIDAERDRLRQFRPFRAGEFATVNGLFRTSIVLQVGGGFGTLDDIVISDRGHFDFAVLVYEDRLYPVPFSFARVDFARGAVVVNASRDRLLGAPSFTRNAFPRLSANTEFGSRVNSHFRAETARRERATDERPRTDQSTERRASQAPRQESREQRRPETRNSRPPEARGDRQPERRIQEKAAPERRNSDTRPADKPATEQRKSVTRPSDKPAATEQRKSDTRPSDKPATEQRKPDTRSSDKQVPQQRREETRSSYQKSAEQGQPDKRPSNKAASEKRASEKSGSEKKDKASDKSTVDRNPGSDQ